MSKNGRPRILHLAHSDQKRGAEVFAGQLARSISSDLFENALCVLNPSDENGFKGIGLPIFAFNGGQKRPAKVSHINRATLWELRQTLKDYQPDVLMAHGASTLKYGAISRFFYRRPISVYKNIGMASFWVRNPLKSKVNRTLLSKFDVVVSLSQRTREDFLRVYSLPSQKVIVIPNGVDAIPFRNICRSQVRAEYRQQLGLELDDTVLINVGSLSPEKGQVELLQLMRDIREIYPTTKLVLVGSGLLRDALLERARTLGVADSVMFLGTRADVPNLLAMSDLFLLSSKTEGMPRVVIEAGMAGLPAVAYDVGAVADAITDGVTGVVVAAGNYALLRDTVIRLLGSPEDLAKFGEMARQRCLQDYDILSVASKYEELFSSLLAAKAKAA